MRRLAVIFGGLVVLAVLGVAGYVIHLQDSRIDDLEASVRDLQSSPGGATGGDVSVRLDEIESQLGFGDPPWPVEGLEERLTEVEWDLNAICGNLHRNGVTVLC